GRHDALLAIQRRALAAGVPFLPVWIEDGTHGQLGPLVIPRESACLRCFVDRRGALPSSTPEAIAVVPHEGEVSAASDLRLASAAAICGAIAAMETVKFLTACAPSGLVGRS